jgi:hypothetical protein
MDVQFARGESIMSQEIEPIEMDVGQSEDDRRSFLKSCGRLAVTVPPVVTMLLSTSLTSPAIAKSTGETGQGNQDTGIERNQDRGIKRNQDGNVKLKQDSGGKQGL